MSELKEIQAAIEKLTKLKAESFPGVWEAITSGVAYGDHWYVISKYESILSISANDGDDEGFREPTAKLISTLHRTIDAQLAILQASLIETGFVMSDVEKPYWYAVVTLARAINGGTNE